MQGLPDSHFCIKKNSEHASQVQLQIISIISVKLNDHKKRVYSKQIVFRIIIRGGSRGSGRPPPFWGTPKFQKEGKTCNYTAYSPFRNPVSAPDNVL